MRPTRGGLGSVAVLAAIALAADRPSAGQATAPQAPGAAPTFRAGTRLATIDAVVVDKDGRHVTDLTPADFEVIERGKRQTIRHAVYVRVAPADGAPAEPPAPTLPQVAGGRADRPAPTGRVIAFVVDDLGLSFLSTVTVRQMLAKYVETQLAPGDLVAIIRTAGGTGSLQQFTSNRRLLNSAIERVRWTAQSRHGVGPFAPVQPSTLAGDRAAGAMNDFALRNVDRSRRSDTYEEARVDLASRGTLGALQYVLRGIEGLPGRKSVVFVSEGFDLGLRDNLESLAWDAFTQVMDHANRAGVVVYTVDPRGLQGAGLTAGDIVQTGNGGAGLTDVLAAAQQARRNELFESQDSLIYLAEQTGGFAVVNTNALVDGLIRVGDDLRGYYLIGVETSLDAGARWDPDDLRLRVTRRGLQVRARRGLFGPAHPTPAPGPTPADPLLTAAMSPFATGGVDVALTAVFGHDAKTGPYLRSRLSIDPGRIAFEAGPDGRRDADLGVLLLAVGDSGKQVAQTRWRVELRLTPDAYRTLLDEGLHYDAHLPIGKPGGYQLRAAVLDERSRDVGTGAQFVEIPKVGKGRLALSGLAVRAVGARRPAAASATPPPLGGAGATPSADPAGLVFEPGSEIVYAAEVYDGRERRHGKTLATRATLLRDGRPLYTTPPAPVTGPAGAGQPVRTIPLGGRLTLGPTFPPGTYSLQVSVGQGPQATRGRQVTQWVDFEVR